MRLGIQLYTVRELTDEASFKSTLTALAGMGFEGVEFAWKYGGMQPDELSDFLDGLGLACCGLHVQLDELLDPDHRVYAYAEATRSRFITTSLCHRMPEWTALLTELTRAATVAAGHGLQFTYHNHWQELDGHPAPCALDALWELPAEQGVRAELDIGWLARAGVDAMAYWRRHGGRTPQVHLRDFDRATQQVCDVGDGFIDPAAAVAQAAELGTQWLIFEQDRYPVSALESCRVCAARVKPLLSEVQK